MAALVALGASIGFLCLCLYLAAHLSAIASYSARLIHHQKEHHD